MISRDQIRNGARRFSPNRQIPYIFAGLLLTMSLPASGQVSTTPGLSAEVIERVDPVYPGFVEVRRLRSRISHGRRSACPDLVAA
jgi:hypothetical protein